MFERANCRQCRNCIEKQPSCKIGQARAGDVAQPLHHLFIRNGSAVKHHLAGDLAGAGSRAFLAHQQLRADLRTGPVDFLLVDGLRGLAQLLQNDGNQFRQVVAAGGRMHAEDAGIGKPQWNA